MNPPGPGGMLDTSMRPMEGHRPPMPPDMRGGPPMPLPPGGMPGMPMPPGGMPMPPGGMPGMPPMQGMPFPPHMPPGGFPQGMPPPPMGMPMGFPGMMAPPSFPHMPPPPAQPQPDTSSSLPSGPSIVTPNPTLYVNNINEKIKIDELKKALFHVFSQFGPIVEISAFKDLRRRGQAWVVFETVASAAKALTEMANFSFYGKPLQVTYARVKSDVVSKKDNTFIARPLRKAPKKRRVGKKSKKEKKEKKEGGSNKREKKDRGDQPDADEGHNGDREDNGAPQQLPPAAPNRILFVENLPKQCTEQMLSMLFQQYPGYKEARLVNGKPGIAFVEFEDAAQSAVAKQSLHNFKITPSNNMKVTFARQ